MDPMSAFEQQLARVAAEMAGPVRPVDAMALVRSAQAGPVGRWSVRLRGFGGGATTPTERGFSMSSALKFVVAAAIVALFGGFLITGVLTTEQGEEMAPAAVTESPSPVTTDELLSGMVTEEAEPGVLRVVNDGYRDVSYPSEAGFCNPWDCGVVIVGDSGHIWRVTSSWQFYLLGQDGEWAADPRVVGLDLLIRYAADAGLDGRLWALSDSGPRVFDDGTWVPDADDVTGDFNALEVQADGTLWLLSDHAIVRAGDTSVERLRWADADGPGDDGAAQPVVTDHGVLWLLAGPDAAGSISFLRFDGTDWQVIPVPDGVGDDNAVGGRTFDVAPDGTLWTAGDPLPQHRGLARLDEAGWTTFTSADGVKLWGGQPAWWNTTLDMLRVAPDGSVWVNATVPGTRACDGLARFDGDSWRPFLSGNCISDYDLAPDGSVWVVAQDPDSRRVHTYVITPEAVAATE